MRTLNKDLEFFARFSLPWCWTCGRVTTHEIVFRWGGRCFLCKECGNIVAECYEFWASRDA